MLQHIQKVLLEVQKKKDESDNSDNVKIQALLLEKENKDKLLEQIM
jgi:hypothetical protein